MAEFQQYPSPVVFHQAMVGVIPRESGGDLKFNFAVDGEHASTETVRGSELTVKGKLLPLRIFPNPSQAGSLVQVSIEDGCDMVSCELVAAPVSSHRVVKELSEAQITYKGDVTIDMYFDGNKLGSSRYFSSTVWKTEKFYMPAGSRGYIFQWKQVENTNSNPRGYVGSFETDISVSDVETPAVPS